MLLLCMKQFMTLRCLIYTNSYLSQPKQCLQETPHRSTKRQKRVIAYSFTFIQKNCTFFQPHLAKEDQKSMKFFWSSQATDHWLSNRSRNSKLAFNGTDFYSFQWYWFLKLNRRLKRTRQEIVWKSPHGEKKCMQKLPLKNMSAYRNQHKNNPLAPLTQCL